MISNTLAAYLYCSDMLGDNATLNDYIVIANKALVCLDRLQWDLNQIPEDISDEELQSIYYEAGKLEFANNLRLWFNVIYWCLFKENQGPRLGQFTSLVGTNRVLGLLHRARNEPFS